MRDRPSCEACRTIYGNKGESPDCETCMPELLPCNEEAWLVYQFCAAQYITAGMGSPIDINVMAVISVMELFEVTDKQDCFLKVVSTARSIISDINEEHKLEAKR